MLFNNRSKF